MEIAGEGFKFTLRRERNFITRKLRCACPGEYGRPRYRPESVVLQVESPASHNSASRSTSVTGRVAGDGVRTGEPARRPTGL